MKKIVVLFLTASVNIFSSHVEPKSLKASEATRLAEEKKKATEEAATNAKRALEDLQLTAFFKKDSSTLTEEEKKEGQEAVRNILLRNYEDVKQNPLTSHLLLTPWNPYQDEDLEPVERQVG